MSQSLDRVPWLLGKSSVNMTPKVSGIGMLGYGNPRNYVKGVETPLSCRTFWMKNPRTGRQLVIVNMEICFPTQSIKDAVISYIREHFSNWNLREEDLVLSAQHTHSAPGGYTHYALYSMSTPGFSQEVLDCYVNAVIKGLDHAFHSLCPGELQIKEGDFSPEVPVAFNRSMKAYNRNIEVQIPMKRNQQHLAVNREMKMLEFLVDKNPWASLNWFAVHCTSVQWRNQFINPDNKGYASLYLEDFMNKNGSSDFVAGFAQGDAGDVSPLFQVPYWKRFFPTKVEDEFKKARTNGRLQYLKAREILGKPGRTILGDFENELIYRDMGKIRVAPEFLPEYLQQEEVYTSPSCLGVAFLKGAENAGIDWPLEFFARTIAKLIQLFEISAAVLINSKLVVEVRNKYKAQRPKDIFVESGAKKLLGTEKVMEIILPSWVDPTVKFFKRMHRENGLEQHSWTPQILPFQISIVSDTAFVMLPFETSTMSGSRIRKSCLNILKQRGVQEILLLPYSNQYAGYITTPEEYSAQCYEGGHTVFGRWTLPAVQTVLKELCEQMLLDEEVRQIDRSLRPPVFTQEELRVRRFSPQNY